MDLLKGSLGRPIWEYPSQGCHYWGMQAAPLNFTPSASLQLPQYDNQKCLETGSVEGHLQLL